jgi:hypothetical protein
MTISPPHTDVSPDVPDSPELLIKEAQRASRRRRLRSGAIAFGILLFVSSVVSTIALYPRSGPSSSTDGIGHGYPYAPDSPILALKLSRLEMLSATNGVGVAPIVTYSGRLLRAYLVRTNDAGATWRVSGALPKGFYPWSTAFENSRDGYVTGNTGTVFTDNGGRTWSVVAVKYSPLAISVNRGNVWVAAEDYCPSATDVPKCGTYLESFHFGNLTPSSTSWVPSDQPVVTQVSADSGYAVGSDNFAGRVYYTSNSGASWRMVNSPCDRNQISGDSVMSSTELLTYCEFGSPGDSGPTVIYATSNGGDTWKKVNAAPVFGLEAGAGSTGQFLWDFNGAAKLSESSDHGMHWTEVPTVRYGTNAIVVTYGVHEAWHVVTGRGIYRTLDGTTWKLLK